MNAEESIARAKEIIAKTQHIGDAFAKGQPEDCKFESTVEGMCSVLKIMLPAYVAACKERKGQFNPTPKGVRGGI